MSAPVSRTGEAVPAPGQEGPQEQTPVGAEDQRAERSRRERIGLAFFWLVILAYGFFVPSILSWNTESHLYPTFALVDHGTIRIDAYQQGLGDKSYWNGHYYTDKAPGLSFLAVPVYAAIRLAFPKAEVTGFKLYRHIANYYYIPDTVKYVRYAITYFLVSLPSAVLAVLLWLFLVRLTGRTGWSLALAAIYALGTIAFVYSIWFFSHQVCAVLLFGAFLLLFYKVRGQTAPWRRAGPRISVPLPGDASPTPSGTAVDDGGGTLLRGPALQPVSTKNQWWRSPYVFAALAGLLAGYSVVSEYPTIVIAAGLGLYLLATTGPAWAYRIRLAGAFIAGMIPPAALELGYNLAAYGRPFATGYEYVHSKAYHSTIHAGFLGLANPLAYGIKPPTLDSIWQITFGAYRGLFVMSPVLLLFIPGLYFMWRRRDLRPEWWLFLGIVVIYFLIDAARGPDTNGWSGGSSVASRHLTPMLPFMIVPIIFVIGNETYRVALAVLGALSVAIMFMTVSATYLFPYTDRNPLVNEVLPSFFHGQIEQNWIFIWGQSFGLTITGFASLLPFVAVAAILVGRIIWLLRSGNNRTGPKPVPRLEVG
jgi:hypothetical protein